MNDQSKDTGRHRRARRGLVVGTFIATVAVLGSGLAIAVSRDRDRGRPGELGSPEAQITATPKLASVAAGADQAPRATWHAGRGWVVRRHGTEALEIRRRGSATAPLRLVSGTYRLSRGQRLSATMWLRTGHGRRGVQLQVASATGRTRVLARRSLQANASGWRRAIVVTRGASPRPAVVRLRIVDANKKDRHSLLVKVVRVSITPRAGAAAARASSGPTPATTTTSTSGAQPTAPTAAPKRSTSPSPAPAAAAAAGDPGTPCPALDYSQAAQGTLEWSDEFNANALDTTKWRIRDGESLSYDQARILKDNVRIRAGRLAITAQRRDVQGRHYTTGYVDTVDRYARRWGRWEMRAKVPTVVGSQARGLWPAFWLRASTTSGEMDVMEAWGEPTTRSDYRSGSYQWTLHQDTNSGPGMKRFSGWGTSAGSAPVANAFHVYAVDWSPQCVVFSFDHHPVGIVTRAQAPWLDTSFASPVNIRLNLQVGQSYWGYANATTALPASYLVDYVRVPTALGAPAVLTVAGGRPGVEIFSSAAS